MRARPLFPHALPAYSCNLQLLCPLLTLCNPPSQTSLIPRLKTNLEWLRFRCHRRRSSVALNSIKHWHIGRVLSWLYGKRHDKPKKDSVQLAAREVGGGAHARPGAEAVVWRAEAFARLEVSLREKAVGHVEMIFVVVCCPRILTDQLVQE